MVTIVLQYFYYFIKYEIWNIQKVKLFYNIFELKNKDQNYFKRVGYCNTLVTSSNILNTYICIQSMAFW